MVKCHLKAVNYYENHIFGGCRFFFFDAGYAKFTSSELAGAKQVMFSKL